MGSNDFTLATLLRGGQIVIIDGYDADKMIDAIEDYAVHYVTVVPGMIEDFYNAFQSSGRETKAHWPNWCHGGSGASAAT